MTPSAFSPPVRVARRLALAAAVPANFSLRTNPRGVALANDHDFRQFQTATTTRHPALGGFRLDHKTPALSPPGPIPMEFPAYQYTAAAVVRPTGVLLEPAGRVIHTGSVGGT